MLHCQLFGEDIVLTLSRGNCEAIVKLIEIGSGKLKKLLRSSELKDSEVKMSAVNPKIEAPVSEKTNKKGLVVEGFVILAVIGLIVSISIPNFRSIQQEGSVIKIEGDLDTLKVAITSYRRNHSDAFPANIHSGLANANPTIVPKTLTDPWNTDSIHNTYGYFKGTDPTFGDYFFAYTRGPKGDTLPVWESTSQQVIYSGSGSVISNAPITKN